MDMTRSAIARPAGFDTAPVPSPTPTCTSLARVVGDRSSQLTAIGLLLIIALAALLRWPGAGDDNLFMDEPLTWNVVRRAQTLDYLAWQHHYEHPPLGYLLVEASMRLAPRIGIRSELLAMRLPSYLCGVLCVPLVFWVMRPLGGRWAALAAAALCAVDRLHVQQSMIARMYPLFILTVLATCLWMQHLLQHPRATDAEDDWHEGGAHPPAPWIILGLLFGLQWWSSGLGLASVAAMALLLIGLGAWQWTKQRRQAGILLAGVATALLIAVLMTHVGLARRLLDGMPKYEPDRPPLERIAAMGYAIRSLIGFGAAGSALLAASAIAGIVKLTRRAGPAALVLPAVAIGNFIGVYFVLKNYHSISPRYIIGVAPALWLGVAAMPLLFEDRKFKRIAAAAVVVLIACGLWQDVSPANRPSTAMAASIKAIRDHHRDWQVLYLPGRYSLVGEYLHLPGQGVLQPWVNSGGHLAAHAAVPAVNLDRPLVVWMTGSYRASVQQELRSTVALLAGALGRSLDKDALARRLQPDAIVTVRFDPGRGDARIDSDPTTRQPPADSEAR